VTGLRLLLVPALVVAIAACSSSSAGPADQARIAVTPPTTTTTERPKSGSCTEEETTPHSYAPAPAGSALAVSKTLERLRSDTTAHLRAGVDESTPNFGVRTEDGDLEGLEVDLVRAIARAIWPDVTEIDDKIQWVAVTPDEKVAFAANGKVDLTASNVTISCGRSKDVAFSTPYFTTPQRIMVRIDSGIDSLADLGGKKVCVPQGVSTGKLLADHVPNAEVVEVDSRPDCLVALQEGVVDAYASHEAILFGMQQQDPEVMTIVAEDLPDPSDYGIAMNLQDAGFVRFVNQVLDDMRADGRLLELYDVWLTRRDYPRSDLRVPMAQYRSES
jgi:polar amino acid transport system substrate-binding protein